MNRFTLTTLSCLLCGLLVWLGITAARAGLSSTAPATTQASSTTASSTTLALGRPPLSRPEVPTTASVPVPPSGNVSHAMLMPRDYTVLLTRSMFVRGHIAEAGHIGSHNTARGSESGASSSTAPSLQQRAESVLVFNGVTQTTTAIDALVEDTTTGRVITVHPGDAIARGRVGKITLDTLEYLSAGRSTLVKMGQNFTGAEGDVTASPAATSQPVGSGASPEDILERLRQRRLQGN